MHASSSSSTSPTQSFPPGFRSRRSHAKSRNGCLTCKQRRKKCDEKRPCCTLCETSLRTCTYASSDQGSSRSGESTAVPSRSSLPSPVPSPPGSFGGGLSWAQPTEQQLSRSPVASSGQGSIIDDANPYNITNSDLYFHFLHHTCRAAPSWQKDRLLLQVGIAKLALDNELASHAVLALAAACLCCDTMAQADADPEKVRHILDLGLEHHTLALEQMRTMTSHPRESDTQPLLASALVIVPFALAFQHIQHWVVRARGLPQQDADLVTPRDMILLLRGIRTTIVALNSNLVENGGSKPKSFWDTMLSSQPVDPTEAPTMPERLHTMYPILASTFYQASWQLKCRIEGALASPQVDEKIDSITETYEILNDIMSSTFLDCPRSKIPFEYDSTFSVSPDSLLAQAPGWLQNFILQRPRPSHAEPLSRSFFAFFSSAPQTYIDLLLPLLDPRTDATEGDRELSTAELLALDVYAHWLTVMLLLEKEAWWVGDFPFVALQGLVSRYGHGFSSASSLQQQWWPAAMLEVAARLKQWK
ncbi:uncharacterized protein Z520_07538 [Fonsecaea multimorphosa CBS 102226]|uniref:Zn(2)-C6 fungal-type domain-containing protein n=1 Tax=Fonsecaea multimorphosa CBS 102226 TaxID=1442371 RepID=A0A0D2KJR9_9EURO|nr:uncharacterized protein Z520_07538 [Fonsecaea multimorphosa CBS 102226]KIX96818.1 hypothetical protein Z520_07538 [Fonsecaea multimorphosa CBS 102226]OAL22498.1 hypothetical protein AYO22_07056 [Fonsecaea multimorphosa]